MFEYTGAGVYGVGVGVGVVVGVVLTGFVEDSKVEPGGGT